MPKLTDAALFAKKLRVSEIKFLPWSVRSLLKKT